MAVDGDGDVSMDAAGRRCGEGAEPGAGPDLSGDVSASDEASRASLGTFRVALPVVEASSSSAPPSHSHTAPPTQGSMTLGGLAARLAAAHHKAELGSVCPSVVAPVAVPVCPAPAPVVAAPPVPVWARSPTHPPRKPAALVIGGGRSAVPTLAASGAGSGAGAGAGREMAPGGHVVAKAPAAPKPLLHAPEPPVPVTTHMPTPVACQLSMWPAGELVKCRPPSPSYAVVKELTENHYGRTVVAATLAMRADGTFHKTADRVVLKFVNKSRLRDKARKVAAAQKRHMARPIPVPVSFENAQLEMQLLHSFNSPHIIGMRGVLFDAAGENWVLVLEYAGVDLLDWVNSLRTAPPLSTVRRVFMQLMQGVLHMHQRGWCHRDISAENLLAGRDDGAVRIIDLGAAARFRPGVEARVPVGVPKKPGWAPPEAYYPGSAYLPGAYDMWSCGQVLFYLLTGTLACDRAVKGDKGMEMLHRHGAAALLKARSPRLPLAIRELAQMMLQPNFRKRSSAAEVVKAAQTLPESAWRLLTPAELEAERVAEAAARATRAVAASARGMGGVEVAGAGC